MGKTIGRVGVRGLDIESLPYKIRVYLNNQVLIPARLVRRLGIGDYKYAKITLRFRGHTETIVAKLLRTRNTFSRQFTIPKDVREKLSIEPGSEIEILAIEPVYVTEEK